MAILKSKTFKVVLGVAAFLLVATAACIALCDLAVTRAAEGRLHDSVDSIPHRKVGLVLDTSPV